jgi:di/tricarboxylate transporter
MIIKLIRKFWFNELLLGGLKEKVSILVNIVAVLVNVVVVVSVVNITGGAVTMIPVVVKLAMGVVVLRG